MKVAPEHMNTLVRVIRWGLLGLGAVFLFVFDWLVPAVVAWGAGLVFNSALRFDGFRRWFVMTLVDTNKIAPQVAPVAPTGVGSTGAGPWQTPASAPASVMQAVHDKMGEGPDLSAHDGMVEDLRQPSLLLKRAWPPGAVAGHSYLGGRPCLPDGVDWPQNPQTGFALHHLAQIDLSEMPRSEAISDLPAQGTLWFFADINEEMIWAARPDNGTSRVLYHPGAVADVPPRAAPENLPQVDHPLNDLEATVSFRGPRPRVYPRWPVTGHLSSTWDIDAVPYEPGAYEAVEAAIATERAKIVGKPEKPSVTFNPFRTVETESGTGGSHRSLSYVPDISGARFPHTGGLALRMAQAFVDAIEGQILMLERHMSGAVSDEDRAGLKAALPKARDLVTQMQDVDPAVPLEADRQETFDAAMRDLVDARLYAIYPVRVLRQAVFALARDGFDAPDLVKHVPDQMFDVARDVLRPSHENAHHYLIAPRTSGANPTGGQGVRLAQFDSDTALGMMFCDVGIVDFWIDAEDLAAGRWARAYATTAGG